MPPDLIPVIAIPARDEEQRLPVLIEALGRQTWLTTRRKLAVTIVLNNCVDASAQAAALAARRAPKLAVTLIEITFSPTKDHAGSARRLAMQTALAAVAQPARAVLLTTDADAVPVPDWIDANLRAIGQGADAVGGLIIGDAAEEARLGPGFQRRAKLQWHYAELADRLASLIDPVAHDPWPRHRDHTGASLAVRGDVCVRVGGLPALPFREDLGFVSRLCRAGFRLRHDPAVRVGVSARLVGRAPGGMADTLRCWVEAEAQGLPLLVEAPDAIVARALCRAMLRRLDPANPRGCEQAASALGVEAAQFHAADGTPLSGTALVEMLAPDEPDAAATMPVEQAISRLERMVVDRQRHAA